MKPAALLAAVALALPGVAAAEAPDESPFALSVGTGPRPLNTLTLGLTGLGVRAMLPLGRAVPYVGLAASSVSVADYEEGDRDARYVSHVSTVHVSPGLRVDLAERGQDTVVLPFVTVGALAGRAQVRTGYADDQGEDWDVVGTTTLGGLAGIGVDAFVTRHLSIGAELGAMGALSLGSSRFAGEVYDQVDTTVLSSFTSLQATVWR